MHSHFKNQYRCGWRRWVFPSSNSEANLRFSMESTLLTLKSIAQSQNSNPQKRCRCRQRRSITICFIFSRKNDNISVRLHCLFVFDVATITCLLHEVWNWVWCNFCNQVVNKSVSFGKQNYLRKWDFLPKLMLSSAYLYNLCIVEWNLLSSGTLT